MYRVTLLIALVCLVHTTGSVAASGVQTQNNLTANITDSRFDPFGGYVAIGRVPKGFSDLGSFQLDLISPAVKGQALHVAGGVYTLNECVFLHFERLDLTSYRLSFSTESKCGVSYSFEGRFLRRGDLSRFPTKVAVLEGVMSKVINGEKVVEGNVRFSYFEPH